LIATDGLRPPRAGTARRRLWDRPDPRAERAFDRLQAVDNDPHATREQVEEAERAYERLFRRALCRAVAFRREPRRSVCATRLHQRCHAPFRHKRVRHARRRGSGAKAGGDDGGGDGGDGHRLRVVGHIDTGAPALASDDCGREGQAAGLWPAARHGAGARRWRRGKLGARARMCAHHRRGGRSRVG
jgi:hypothetical protein